MRVDFYPYQIERRWNSGACHYSGNDMWFVVEFQAIMSIRHLSDNTYQYTHVEESLYPENICIWKLFLTKICWND